MNNPLESHINRIIGQLESLKKEVSKDNYNCEYAVDQLKVIIGSTKSLAKAVAKEDIEKCLKKKTSKENHRKVLLKVIEAAFQ
jgi:DNA-binding FrmR family transcriptional regulator